MQLSRTQRRSLHGTWYGMKRRCHDTRCEKFSIYGARGIKVCDRWRYSFANFVVDLLSGIGPRPAGKSLDRIDNDGDYEPGNVRWATGQEQNRNRRDNVLISYQGKTQTLIEWAGDLGIHQTSLRARIQSWGSTDAALSVAGSYFVARKKGLGNIVDRIKRQAIHG